MLTKEDKKTLLQVARNSIKSALQQEDYSPPSRKSPPLGEKRGAFVTLHSRGDLRGCIGYVEGVLPLIETVQEAAVKAALEDPRFPQVTLDELAAIEIEISVLTPLERIFEIDKINVGKHGLVVKNGHSRGLLLPQVATEYGWDLETFLSQTCRKAGIGPGKWKDPATEIYIFSAEVFGERNEN